MSRTTVAAVGSLAVLGLLVGGLWWRQRDTGPDRPLVVYAAAAVRVPLEAAARDYEAEHGRRVELRFGASEDVLTKVGLVNPSDPADLFLPADDSYVRLARDRGLVAESFPLATMRAVLLVAPGNSKGLAAWPDLLRDGVRVAVSNPAAAVGKLTRDHLAATGRWAALKPRVADTGTVTEAANAAKVGAADAAVVWDAVAVNYPGQKVLTPPELAGVVGRVEVAVLAQSADRDAARAFARYLADPERGLKTFRAAGFTVGSGAPP
ncbi:MAG TPA: molybdate ABC transporter substrate-binding protein [Urbifossiella sp.]|nr:molybdate ABC transporter substrate-binding protein [Urbifossiella sp.]